MQNISFDWVWYGDVRRRVMDLSEQDRLSLGLAVATICGDPWPDWRTKDWVEDAGESLTNRLIVYLDDEWVLVYEIPQPLVVVFYSFDRLV